MFYELRKELGFTRHEWWALDWIDRRMYTEQMSMIKYEQSLENWKQAPASKRGAPPKKPEFRKLTDPPEGSNEKPADNNGMDLDISTVEGMDITTV